jgi:hypothetical protein
MGKRVIVVKTERNDVPVVKPVRRGKWLMMPPEVKISRRTITAAIRADRDAR